MLFFFPFLFKIFFNPPDWLIRNPKRECIPECNFTFWNKHFARKKEVQETTWEVQKTIVICLWLKKYTKSFGSTHSQEDWFCHSFSFLLLLLVVASCTSKLLPPTLFLEFFYLPNWLFWKPEKGTVSNRRFFLVGLIIGLRKF